MYYSTIKDCDIANGVGCRVSLFVSGCTNHCKDCFQPETWDFRYGKPFTSETEDRILQMLKKDYIRGLTILGGEPMEPENQVGLISLLRRVKKDLPQKDIWCYSGFTYEVITSAGSHPHCEVTEELLSCLDVLVDGRFVAELKDPSLWFRGSSNQRIIDVKKTLESGTVQTVDTRDRKPQK